MIKQEEYKTNNGTILIHTWSDNEKKCIKQIETGIIYSEAFDIPNKYTYEEVEKDEGEKEE